MLRRKLKFMREFTIVNDRLNFEFERRDLQKDGFYLSIF